MKSSANRVQAVVFDISGTIMDFGSRGPVAAFVELFARQGVAISAAEARRPMGMHKIDHIWSLLRDESIAQRWLKKFGHPPTDEEVQVLYREYTQVQIDVLPNHCDLIPGVMEVIAGLRERDIRYANTTGFDWSMMDEVIRQATSAGYSPDIWVTPDQVGKGRPAPWMIFHAAKVMDRYPLSTFVKVGDTIADIQEAQAAGVWMVAVVRSGNEVGLSSAELAALDTVTRETSLQEARQRLLAAGAHVVIDTVADLLPVIDSLNQRIAAGEKP